MKISISGNCVFFESTTFKKCPLVYDVLPLKIDFPDNTVKNLMFNCPALVYDTDLKRITADSAARVVINTSAGPDGSVHRVSFSLVSYLVHLYAIRRCHGTKQAPSTSDLGTKTFTLSAEETNTYGVAPFKSKKKVHRSCDFKFHNGNSMPWEDAPSVFGGKMCVDCVKKWLAPCTSWHTRESLPMIMNASVYREHFSILEEPGIWYTLLGIALGNSSRYARRFLQSPFLLTFHETPNNVKLWAQLCGRLHAFVVYFLRKPSKVLAPLEPISGDLLSRGWAEAPSEFKRQKGINHILTRLTTTQFHATPLLYMRSDTNIRYFSKAFYECILLLKYSPIHIEIKLMAPLFGLSAAVKGVRSHTIDERSHVQPTQIVIGAELLTWDQLYILLKKTSHLTVCGSYLIAKYGIKSCVSGVTDGYCFMYLVDWCMAEAPHERFVPHAIEEENYRSCVDYGLIEDEERVASTWTLAKRAILLGRRPRDIWPPQIHGTSCHDALQPHSKFDPLPPTSKLHLPRASDITTAKANAKNKRRYSSFLPEQQKRPKMTF